MIAVTRLYCLRFTPADPSRYRAEPMEDDVLFDEKAA
jgi:hypothetical protein